MQPMRFPVTVLMQRTPMSNRWVSERWEPVAVEPQPEGEGVRAPERIADDASGTRWRFSGHLIELHPSEVEGYFLNLAAPEPKVFVMWRLADDGEEPAARPWIVTVSYNQAARMLDGGEQAGRRGCASRHARQTVLQAVIDEGNNLGVHNGMGESDVRG